MTRRCSILWLPILVGCSFGDDFDRFRAYDGSDGGESEAVSPSEALGERDAGRSTDDPMRAADAAVLDRPADQDGGLETRASDAAVGGEPRPGVGDDANDPVCGASCDDAGGRDAAVGDAAVGDVVVRDAAVRDAELGAAPPAPCGPGRGDAPAEPAEGCGEPPRDCPGPVRRCYPDLDSDGFANLEAPVQLACVCPTQHLEVIDDDVSDADQWRARHDCWDATEARAAEVHPGQTKFFEQAYTKPGAPPSYDYDCRDGEQPKTRATLPASGCSGLLDALLCESTAAFAEPLPACGEVGTYTTCSGGVLALGCSGTNERRTQACR